MRANLLLLIAPICAAQISAPVPADPYELVTGKTVAKPADRTQALVLLNKAKRPMRLLAPMTPPYLLTVSFTATGDPANSGTGELTELWLGQQNWRWTSKLGDFSMRRIATRAGVFDEKPVAMVPMRVHMLRNSIFWAGQGLTASSQFRSAAVEWKGRPTTCLLVSEQAAAEQPGARRWDESEYCIDDQTGLLQILSVAPGNYAVYSYAEGVTYHGQPLPERIKTYVAGALVIDAGLRIEEPTEQSIPGPTAEMLAADKPVVMEEPMRRRIDLQNPSVSGMALPVIVNAQVGPSGKVVVEELCAAADPTLGAKALDQVKTMDFGRSEVQRQAYVEVRFVPAATAASAPAAIKPAVAIVPAEPYYLERTISGPERRSDGKEILARRVDGATVRMTTFGPGEHYLRELKFPDGRSLMVYDEIKVKVTWPALSAAEKERLRSLVGQSDCSAGRTLLRHDQVEGQDVDVFQITTGSYRATLWAAPKLGCETLYVNAETIRQNGSFEKTSETKTTKLVIGEPESHLFEIAPDLVEMKPSEAMQRMWESLDLGLDAEQKAGMLRELRREGAEADRRYQGKGN
jgi:hypothetical protein